MAQIRTDRLPGTLDLLVLRVLQRGAMHGWAIAQRLEEVSCDVLTVGQGSLYPALYRLEDTGFLVAEWGQTDAGRRARFYKLTKLGRAQLARERASWDQYIAAVGRVLELA